MDTIIILALLLVVAVGGWISCRFKYEQLTAYLALKNVETPTEEEWELLLRPFGPPPLTRGGKTAGRKAPPYIKRRKKYAESEIGTAQEAAV